MHERQRNVDLKRHQCEKLKKIIPTNYRIILENLLGLCFYILTAWRSLTETPREKARDQPETSSEMLLEMSVLSIGLHQNLPGTTEHLMNKLL